MKTEKLTPDINVKNDSKIIQLAGYHAYLNPEKSKVIQVDGNECQVIDTTHDPRTGLEAFVVKDAHDKNDDCLLIVFIGSQHLKDDMYTSDLKLLYGKERSTQMEAAKVYFENTENTYGEGTVRAVAGISLAGSLANAIAINHPDVRSVTLNPFMLPYGMADPNHDYPNITNYYSKNDFLTNIQETLYLGERVPGRKYHIHNGLSASPRKGNDIDRLDHIESEYKVPVGVKGEAGYGFIHVGVEDHIITSLWTGVPLYGGPSEKINIDQNSLYTLANSLKHKVIQRADLARVYIEKANEIVVHEQERFNKRISELQQSFYHIYHVISGMSWYGNKAEKASQPQTIVDQLVEWIHVVQEKTRLLDKLYHGEPGASENNPPYHLQRLFSSIRACLTNVRKSMDKYISSKENVMTYEIPDLLTDGNGYYIDAVVSELKDYYSILTGNMERILEQIDIFKTQVETGAAMLRNKKTDAEGRTRTPLVRPDDSGHSQERAIISLGSLPHLKERMKIKKQQVDRAYEKINAIVTERLRPILEDTCEHLVQLNEELSKVVVSVQSTLQFQEKMLNSRAISTEHEKRIGTAIQEVISQLNDIQLIIEALQKAFIRLIEQQPELMKQLKSKIDAAIFASERYSNVRLYNIACSSIMDEMEILFKDITFQLSDEQDATVHTSMEIARSIEENFRTMSDQVEHAIF